MAIKVAAIGTGNVGKHALTQLIVDPRFELTGVWVSSESKAGKDAACVSSYGTCVPRSKT